MYLPSFTYPSKSGSIASPLLTDNGAALLDHSTVSGRRVTEHRGHWNHEPRHRPPWEWSLYHADRSVSSAHPACFNLPQEAVRQGLPSPSGIIFNPCDCFLCGSSGPHFQRGFAGEPRGLLGGYSDTRLVFPGGRSTVLPPVFNQFSHYAEEGSHLTENFTRGRRENDTVQAEWMRCPNRWSSEWRVGTDSTEAAIEEKEDRQFSRGQAPSRSLESKFHI